MSYIQNLRSKQSERNKNKITVSVRLSLKMNYILEELADEFETTRQELIVNLIQEHIVKDWEAERTRDKQLEVEEDNTVNKMVEPRYFLLNTNIANDEADHDFMLQNKVAAAFEDGWMQKINRIKKGDYVFLYASGQGIVAYGRANGLVEKGEHYGIADKTFFQQLEEFKDITNSPIKAKKIRSILNRSFPFAPVLSKISDGQKILDYIKNNNLND